MEESINRERVEKDLEEILKHLITMNNEMQLLYKKISEIYNHTIEGGIDDKNI